MSSIVSVARAEDMTEKGIKNATYDAIRLCEFRFPKVINLAILKVNLRYYWDYSTGETTDPRVVSAIVDYIRDHCGQDVDIIVAEADASAMRTKYAFKMLGYEELASKKALTLMNLCECTKVDRKVVVDQKEFVLPVAELMLDADLIVNVPKLRTHRLTNVSCCLKNMFGSIAKARKIIYHPILDEAIVGINKLTKAQLAVIDGIVALGKKPIKMGIILAGEDSVAVDSVAAKIMGYEPRRIRHLTLAESNGIGTTTNVKVTGIKDLTDLRKLFPHENYFLYNLSWNLKLKLLNIYLAMTGDTRPPVLDT